MLSMSILIQTTRSADLSLSVAEEIYNRLTKPKSDTNKQLFILIHCLRGESPLDNAPDWPMSFCLHRDPYTDSLRCVGWVSVTEWDRCLALQGFVDPDYRHKGLATALTSTLLVDGVINQSVPVAVFADEFVRITQGLGFTDIRRYRVTDDGWLRSERLLDESETAARSGQE